MWAIKEDILPTMVLVDLFVKKKERKKKKQNKTGIVLGLNGHANISVHLGLHHLLVPWKTGAGTRACIYSEILL